VKTDYDKNLYIEIANFRMDEIVQVSNRKGKRLTIHIQNITRLTWRELQLLMPAGEDRFSKMVLLYNKYANHGGQGESDVLEGKLSSEERNEINEYLKIFRDNSFSKHFEVNQHISDNNLWERFPTIRSLNDHGSYKEIPGIQPKYFEIVCQLLSVGGEGGLPLDAFRKY
jgi:hypothetical protein